VDDLTEQERKKDPRDRAKEVCIRYARQRGKTLGEQLAYFSQCYIDQMKILPEPTKTIRVPYTPQSDDSEARPSRHPVPAFRAFSDVAVYLTRLAEGAQHCLDESRKAPTARKTQDFQSACLSDLWETLKEPPPKLRGTVADATERPASKTAQIRIPSGRIAKRKRTRVVDAIPRLIKGMPRSEWMLPVPFHPAKRRNYCTVASLQMVLDYFGVTPLPDQDVLHEHCPYFEKCDVNPLAQYGLKARKVHLWDGEQALIRALGQGLPVILRIRNPKSHSVVFLGLEYGGANFIYHDPARSNGPSKIEKEVLLEQWGQTHDYALIFEKGGAIS